MRPHFKHIAVLVFMLLVSVTRIGAQTLAPAACQQFFSASGIPLAGGFLYSFTAGSSTPTPTYADSAASIPNSNPIILNAGGFPVSATGGCGIWLSQSTSYKFTVQNSTHTAQWTVDNISSSGLLSLANTWGLLQTFSSGITGTGTIGGLGLGTTALAASNTWTGAATFSGSSTLNNPCSINGYFYVSSAGCYTTLPAALAAVPSGAGGGGTVYLPCNTTLGPYASLTINNGTVMQGCSPSGEQIASGRSVIQMSADLALSSCQNIAFRDVILEFNQTGSGVHITSCQKIEFWHTTLNQCGSSSKACLLLDTNCNTSGCNTTNVTSDYMDMFCNNASAQYCLAAIKLTGSGPVNAGSFVTLNSFKHTYLAGNVFGAVDIELNADSNRFFVLDDAPLSYTPGSGSYVLAFNLANSSSDQDSDGDMFTDVTYTGTATTSYIRAGNSNGNKILTAAGSGFPTMTNLGTTTFINLNTIETLQLPSVNPFVVPMSSIPGALNAGRFGAVNCTHLTSSNFVLSTSPSWGTSPAFGAIVGCDTSFFVNITSGSGSPAANPTVTLTFADGTFGQAPSCSPYRGDTASPSAYWAYSPSSATTAVFTFVGTPSASTGYTLGVTCIAKPN